MQQQQSSKRKERPSPSSPPKPLGVLEFTSALNGDDPLQILQKLHQFVRVVEYERGLVTAAGHADGSNDGSIEAAADAVLLGGLNKNDGGNESDDDVARACWGCKWVQAESLVVE